MNSMYYLSALRSPKNKLILELQNLILVQSVAFYERRGICWLSAPITTASISSPIGLGSDSLPVKVSLEGRDTYLADSMQFLLEYGCRFFNKGCWYVMPSFRGEDVDDSHLKQFFHSEVEILGGLEDIMKLAENYIKFLSEKIQCFIGEKDYIRRFIDNEIPRISFEEAVKILDKSKIKYGKTWRSITKEGEADLIRYFNSPVWLMYHDRDAVPFYQKSLNGRVLNADLLMGIGETIGCGERWRNGKEVTESLRHYALDPIEYDWYVKMKESFPLQTSGFGMGIERFLLFILNERDIRDMQVFRRFNDGKDVV